MPTGKGGVSARLAPSANRTVSIYEATTAGGTSILAVNPSREFVPRRATVASGAVGGEPALGAAPVLREQTWIYVLVVLLLCAEWLVRRRVGLR